MCKTSNKTRGKKHMKARIILLLVLLLSVVPASYAHDEKMHQGPMTEGVVESVSGDKLQLKTEKGSIAVAIVKETKVEMGMGGTPAAKEDIRVGDYLMVAGHKLESGELAAGEIMIHRKAQTPGKEQGKTQDGHEGMKMEHDMPGMK
jgi:hypothetical protein